MVSFAFEGGYTLWGAVNRRNVNEDEIPRFDFDVEMVKSVENFCNDGF